MTTLRSQQYAGDGVTLQVVEGPPHGPRLLFLHGLGRRWQDFWPLMPALMPTWHLFAADTRGHGLSQRQGGKYRICDSVFDMLSVVCRLTEEQEVVLFGHSMGALVAAAVAAEVPDRVRALILEDPPTPNFLAEIRPGTTYFAQFVGMQQLARDKDAPLPELTRRLAEMVLPRPDGSTFRLGDTRDAVALRFLARCLQQVDPDVYTPLLEQRWLDGYDWDAIVSAIACPVLLLAADPNLGGMLSPCDAKTIIQRIEDCTYLSFPGLGHHLHGSAPEVVVRAIIPFLASLD